MGLRFGRGRRGEQAPPAQAESQEVDHLRAGDQARDARDWPAAAKAYKAVLDDDPGLGPIWVQYGHALKEAGDTPGARSRSMAAASSRPPTAAPWPSPRMTPTSICSLATS